MNQEGLGGRVPLFIPRDVFYLQVLREEDLTQNTVAVVTSHTCQISSELPQVSVEVIKLDLCCQEDVLRFRKWEHALVCASALVENNQC